jgi:outer membrane protein TolC
MKLTNWLNRMVIAVTCSAMLFISASCLGQEGALSLNKAYELATANYPMIKQRDLIKTTADLNVKNLASGYLPQFNVSGQATYQSDVTKVDVPVPGFKLDPPAKDQYKIVAEASQLVYDGGTIRYQKEMQDLNANVENQKLEVELYRLRERINQIYLGILYLDQQLAQVKLIKDDVNTGIKRVEAQVNNGVAFKSNLNLLKAELLKAEQREIELRATRKGFVQSLALFVNQDLPENISLETPSVAGFVPDNNIARPELKLYGDQTALLGQQNKLIRSRILPRTSLFIQGGYGRPALNMLKNEFEFFYIGGIRFNWNLGSIYTMRKERELVDISRKMIEIQKETFLLNTNTQLTQQRSEIEKLSKLIETDDAIIDLRVQVKNAAKAQLENGVITANDYVREVNAEDQARQGLITHQIQLLQAQINYQTISGKQ